MFNTESIIEEVNILNKAFCYFIVLIAFILCKKPFFLLLMNLFILLITKQYWKLFFFHLGIVGMNILSIFFPQFLWITKLGVFILYTILLKKVTKTIELRYLLESTLYRFQSKKITYQILYFIYFGKYFKRNFQLLLHLKDEYGFSYQKEYFLSVLKQAYQKTKIQMHQFLVVNQLRFYNDSKTRTYIEKPKWESWDSNYLIIHLILFCFVCVYGR